MFDEKQKKVTITVVTCCPEVILEKIKRKGAESVKSIEIVPEKKKEDEKKKDGEKKDSDKKKDAGDKPKDSDKKDKPKDDGKKKDSVDVKKLEVEPVSGFPTIYPGGTMIYPAAPGGYYPPYYGGYVGVPGPAPYYHGPGRRCNCFDCRNTPGYYAVANPNRFDCFSEENPSACSIM